MVAIFTGAGSGFERGSGTTLGGAGLIGSATLGRNGEQLFVNAATGNLLISQQDEILIGRGPDAAISRTYNSLGDLSDDNGDNWRQSTDRRVYGLTGTLNSAGSTVRRVSGDGSDILYTWNYNAYVATDGSGAYDRLTSSGGTWTWTDGLTQLRETYSAYGAYWRLTQQTDTDGNSLTFSYSGANVSRVATADGAYVDYIWSGANIAQITTGFTDLATGAAKAQTRTRYSYDAQNRLTSVSVDLSPQDGSIADGKAYVTNYTYDGTSRRIAKVAQTDGSSLAISYDGAGRVASFAQTVASGVTRTTTLTYGSGFTSITDPAGQVTRLDYASSGTIAPPEAWTVNNATQEAATIGGRAATKFTVQASGAWYGATQNAVLAGETVTLALTLQAVGTATSQAIGLSAASDGWGSAGISSARIVSGPGQLVQRAGGLWVVNGLSATEGTRIEVTRTFKQNDTADAYVYIDEPGGYRAGSSLIVQDVSVAKSATAADPAKMDLANWSNQNLLREAAGTIDGANAYKYTVQNPGAFAAVSTTLSAKPGDTYSFSVSLQATLGGATTQSLGLYGSSSEWGGNAAASARIVSGPGTITRTEGGLFTVSGLSATQATRIEVTRTYEEDENGSAYVYVDLPGGHRAASSLIASAAHLTKRIVAPANANQLIKITAPPAHSGAAAQVVEFVYTSKGDLQSVWDTQGNQSWMSYSGTGNVMLETDRLSNTISRSYGARNELLAETRNGSNGSSADAQHTTRYVYDSEHHLRFIVGAEGNVVEYRYTAAGELEYTIEYPENFYDVSGLAPHNMLTEAQLSAAVASIADRSSTKISRNFYDARGNLTSTIRYGAATAAGDPSTAEGYSRTNFTYDQAGQLLASQSEGQGTATYVYDGLGRMTASTDLNGGTTSIVFNDSATSTVVTLAGGLVQTSTYNKAGELVSASNSGSYTAGGTSTYKYDAEGRVRQVTDATGHKTYFLYDKVGRKVAEVTHQGALVEYRYDSNDRVIATTRFATNVSSTALTQLADPASTVEMSAIRPAGTTRDIWTWNIYDREGRIIETVDGTGSVSTFAYDKSGRLVKTVSYTTRLTSTQLVELKANPPTSGSLVLPVANAAKDQVARTFYDKEGRLIAELDGEGFLTRMIYDRAGQKTEEITYLNPTNSTYRASGTLDQLVSTLPVSPDDRRTRFVYDGQGLLRYRVNGLNQVIKLNYNAAGLQVGTTRYPAPIGATSDYTYDNIKNMLAAAGLPLHPDTRRVWSIVDGAGRVAYSVDSEGSVAGFNYDTSGRVTKSVHYATPKPPTNVIFTLAEMDSWAASASSAHDRITRNFYTARGELKFNVDAEGYVTRYDTDNEGRITAELRWDKAIAIADGATIDTVNAAVAGAYRTQSYSYDVVGRLSYSTDGEGNQRSFVYNPNGTLASEIALPGHADRSETFYTYDGSGRVTAEYRAYKTTDQTLTRYTYDGHGNLLTVIDPRGNATTHSYDRLGRLISQTDALGGIVRYEYNAFDEAVKKTDARGNASYNYYDRLGRVVATRDSENYVTETAYTSFGEVESVTRRYNRASNAASATVRPTYTAHAKDATTSFLYDKLGRLRWTADAEGHEEHYGLDAFGQRTSVQNKLESVIINGYDRRGLLISETLPMASVDMWGDTVSETVTNRFEYDGRGNRTKRIEAYGLPEQRMTTYVYDKADRLIETWGDTVTVVSQLDHASYSQTRPVERIKYDGRGNVVEQVDALGARSLFYYDKLNQVVAQLNALGTLSTFVYDKNGNVEISRVYGTPIALPGTAGGAAPTPPAGEYRETTQTYDKLDRLKTSSISGVHTGAWNGSFYVDSVGAVTTSLDYDANGNVVKSVDGNGGAVFSYYDKLGRKTCQIDQEMHITRWVHDAEGNVTHERRFAKKTAYAGLDTYWEPMEHADDRVTDFTYDRNGRRRTEQRSGIVSYEVATNGTLVAGASVATITYSYNGLGQVTQKIEATGEFTDYDYDGMGRLTWERKPAFEDHGVTMVQPTVRYSYDGLNNLTRTRQGKEAMSGSDRITRYKYGADGRLESMIDPAGGVFTYAYDAAGNLVREGYNRKSGAWPTGPNLIVNGSFEESDPNYTVWSYGRRNVELPGWTMENGQAFEQHTSGIRGVEASDGTFWMDLEASPGNLEISQAVGGLTAGNVMLLQFDHANSQTSASGSFEVYWNGTLVATITDSDQMMQTKSLELVAIAGENVVKFKGIGPEDKECASIDNVRLFATFGNGSTGLLGPSHQAPRFGSNLLVNGGFEQSGPYTATSWGRSATSLPGWTKANGENFEQVNSGFQGVASTEGSYWLDLDATPGNMDISQTVSWLQPGQKLLLQFDHANRTTSESGSFEVYWNGSLVATITDTGTTMQTKSFDLYAADGDNVLTFRGIGTSDTAGVSLDNVRLLAAQPDGPPINEGIVYARDLLGRVTSQALASWTGWSWSWGDSQQTAYNAYGETSQRGINGGGQEHFAYDGAGRLWRSNSGDGVWRYYLSDANGNRTLAIESEGTDLAFKTMAEVLAIATGEGAHKIGASHIDGINATINVFDKRGQATETLLPKRQLSEGVPPTDLSVGRSYNAFGEIISERNAEGKLTNITYNTMGRSLSIQRTAVSVTLEDGTVQSATPTDSFFYDISGRLVGVQDANGNRTTRSLLQGSGYGDAKALVIREFHPDQGILTKGYDVFGDLRVSTDEITRTTTMTYDAMGRLIEQAGPGGLTDGYAYDLLGHRVLHWNNHYQTPVYEDIWVEDGPGEGHWETIVVGYTPQKELTDYDLQGRVTRQVAFGGDTTKMTYSWSSFLTTNGMGMFGGWTQTTEYANGRSSKQKSDVFGRDVFESDLDGRATSYSYDNAGRVTQKNGGETINYTYFNTGMLATAWKGWGVVGGDHDLTTTAYGYDKLGNKLSEKYTHQWGQWVYPESIEGYPEEPYYTSGSSTYQDATASYDALGRMTQWVEAGNGTTPPAKIDYEYDANGNVRRTRAEYRTLDGQGVASATPAVQDQWYRYDSMNRVVTAKGILAGGQIQRGYGGNDYAYDKAGQRVSASRTIQDWGWVENPNWPGSGEELDEEPRYIEVQYDAERREDYTYYGNGNLKNVRVGQSGYTDNGDGTLTVTPPPATGALKGAYIYDTMGRLTQQTDYAGDGSGAVYDRKVFYNGKGQVYNDIVVTKQGSDTFKTVTDSHYGAGAAYLLGAVAYSTSTHYKNNDEQSKSRTDNTYDWYDGAVLATVKNRPNLDESKVYNTTYHYNAAGVLSWIGISDTRTRTINFTNDMNGQAIRRDESDNSSNGDPHEVWYRFGGKQMGYIGNNGTLDTDYQASISNRTRTTGTGAFRFGTATGSAHADFDMSVDPINSYNQGSATGSYTVRAGDTLQGIAATLWGDSSLWYKLAEANGMSAENGLVEGQRLTIPAGVMKSRHSASTFKPYDAGEVIGDTSPSAPKPPKQNKCATFGKIMLVIVAIAVTAIVFPYALAAVGTALGTIGITGTAAAITSGVVAGGISGAAGSVVSQGIGVKAGILEEFSWKEVAIAGISGAVTGGLGAGLPAAAGSGGALGKAGRFLQGSGVANQAVKSALGNALTQGLAMATTLQDKFNWAGFAAAVVGGGTGAYTGSRFSSAGKFVNAVIGNSAGMIAEAAVKSLEDGTSFGDNIRSALPGMIGSTVGNAVVDYAAARIKAARLKADNDGTSGTAQAGVGAGNGAADEPVAGAGGGQIGEAADAEAAGGGTEGLRPVKVIVGPLSYPVPKGFRAGSGASQRILDNFESPAFVAEFDRLVEAHEGALRMSYALRLQTQDPGNSAYGRQNDVLKALAYLDGRESRYAGGVYREFYPYTGYAVTDRLFGASGFYHNPGWLLQPPSRPVFNEMSGLQRAGYFGLGLLHGAGALLSGVGAVATSELCATGIGCVVPISLGAGAFFEADNAQAAFRKAFSGGEAHTVGAMAISATFGTSMSNAESAYGYAQLGIGAFAFGTNAVVNGGKLTTLGLRGGAVAAGTVPSKVTAFRVEGTPNQHFIIDEAGNVSLTDADKTIWINFGQEGRAQSYFERKVAAGLPDAQLKSFEIDASFLDEIRATAVPEKFARAYPNAPIISADPYPDQFGIRPEQFDRLIGAIRQGSGRNVRP